jgi:hypothetical protein
MQVLSIPFHSPGRSPREAWRTFCMTTLSHLTFGGHCAQELESNRIGCLPHELPVGQGSALAIAR